MLDSSAARTASRDTSRALEALARIPATIAEVMTRKVTTLLPDASVFDAVQLFGECGYRHMLVVDGAGKLVGVLSDRDALRSMARGHAATTTQVAAVMARDSVVARPDMPLIDAINLMAFHHIHCLPVVDGGGVCGIVTTTDLLAAFHEFLDRIRLLPP